jgi:hypothetical protein
MTRDLATGTDTVAVRAADLRQGDRIGPRATVTEVRRLAPLRLLVRTSSGHSDLVAPGRWYHVATDRPTAGPAVEAPGDARIGVAPWYCPRCDAVAQVPWERHRHSVPCALGQDAIAHPYDPDHSNA